MREVYIKNFDLWFFEVENYSTLITNYNYFYKIDYLI